MARAAGGRPVLMVIRPDHFPEASDSTTWSSK